MEGKMFYADYEKFLIEKEAEEKAEHEKETDNKSRRVVSVVIFAIVVCLVSSVLFTDRIDKLKMMKYGSPFSVPSMYQWDERWQDVSYAGTTMKVAGCGPTCLSMVSMYLLSEPEYTPDKIAEFGEEEGYAVPGAGSKWTLFSEGAEKLGLVSMHIDLSRKSVVSSLQEGNPIVCIVGPGDFTKKGHFIVLSDYKKGKIKVNDPNGKADTEYWWDYSRLKGQIRDLWAFKAA